MTVVPLFVFVAGALPSPIAERKSGAQNSAYRPGSYLKIRRSLFVFREPVTRLVSATGK
jgi:hypothetical protein